MSPRPPFPPPAPARSGKQRLIIGILLGIVLLGGVFSFLLSGTGNTRPAAKKESIVTITLPPPPPPPPPPKVEPPKTEPPPEEKKEELVEEEPPPEAPPEPAPDSPPEEVLGTNIQGGGPGLSGLGTRGNGGGTRNSLGGGASAKARIDWYAKRVLATTIRQALERDPATRHIVMNGAIRVWVDKEGTILRVSNQGANTAALEKVLVGLRTPQAPPSGMPSSIDLQISARKRAAA